MSLYPEYDVVEVIVSTIFKSKECLSVEGPCGSLDSATSGIVGRTACIFVCVYIARVISIDALVEFGQRVILGARVIVAILAIQWCDEKHDVVASWEIVGSFLVVVLAEESQFV